MEISNVKALPYLNTSAETTLQTDASKKGLEACLIQNGKVICYASRALTKTEQNYQNLEREALGTIWVTLYSYRPEIHGFPSLPALSINFLATPMILSTKPLDLG